MVTAGLATVGLRMPAHPLALELIRAAGVPIAAPSANRFTGLSPTGAAHIPESLADYVLDGGPARVGIESTVLSLVDAPLLLRPGVIPLPEIEALIGPVATGGGARRRARRRRACTRATIVLPRRCTCWRRAKRRPMAAARGCGWGARCPPIRASMPPRCTIRCTVWTRGNWIGSRWKRRRMGRSGGVLDRLRRAASVREEEKA